jgi:hypothetical protein
LAKVEKIPFSPNISILVQNWPSLYGIG